MPRERDQNRYITFHNDPSASSESEVVSIHHNFKLMDTSTSNANSRNTITNSTASKPSRWQRYVFAIRRTLCLSSKKKPASLSSSSQYNHVSSSKSSRRSFWCCCWCGSSPPPTFNTNSPDTVFSSRYHAPPVVAGNASRTVEFSRHANRLNSSAPSASSTQVPHPPIVVHGVRKPTLSGKLWNGDDSFRSNSDRFLETLEQDMEAERTLQRNRGKRPFQVALLFRGIQRHRIVMG